MWVFGHVLLHGAGCCTEDDELFLRISTRTVNVRSQITQLQESGRTPLGPRRPT